MTARRQHDAGTGPRALDEDPWHRAHLEAGYVLCRPHGEYHRPPECPIDQQGQPMPWWGDDDPVHATSEGES